MADIYEFIRKFTHTTLFKQSDVVKIDREWYLVHKKLRDIMAKSTRRPVAAGMLLAAQRGESVRPSVQLLDMLARSDAKKAVLNEEAEWLCICGRPPLLSSVVKHDNIEKGDTVVLMNRNGEALGYGVVRDDWSRKKAIIELQYDIGDFLRRERRVMRKPASQRRGRRS